MHIQCEFVGRVGKVPEETVGGMFRFSVMDGFLTKTALLLF